eukprot:UN34235
MKAPSGGSTPSGSSPPSTAPSSSAPSSTSGPDSNIIVPSPAALKLNDYEEPMELTKNHTRRNSLDFLQLKRNQLMTGLLQSIETHDEILHFSDHVEEVVYNDTVEVNQACVVVTSQAVYHFPPLLEVEKKHI